MNCSNCGKQFPFKKNKKFCSTSCRVLNWRKNTGTPEPEFLKASKQLSGLFKQDLNSVKSKPLIPPASLVVRDNSPEIQLVMSYISYWENTIDEAKRGIMPAWSIGLGTVGAILGRDEKGRGKDKYKEMGADSMALMLIGGLIGYDIDKKRAEKRLALIPYATEQIKGWKRRLNELKQTGEVYDEMKRSGNLVADTKKTARPSGTIISAIEYREEQIHSIKLHKKWSYLIGEPSENFYMILHGMPGNGKSTFAIQFAQDFHENNGKVLYMASEQNGMNYPLQTLLERNNATFDIEIDPKKYNLEQIAKRVNPYKLIVLDSVNHLCYKPEDIEQLRKLNPKTAFLSIFQSTKDGDFKGGQEHAHNSDIIVKMEKGRAYQTKSRFAPPTELLIF